ncbi:MAG: hypothetical protein H7061_03710 [Bdellovibrionaceae bacterium]|nr:hypothetical protein [Bdellovibrio sp.]
MLAHRKSCYCAFCKTPRKVYAHKHLTTIEVVSLVMLSIVVTYSIYHTMDPRGLFISATVLIVAEIFTHMKWRTSMICRSCGFDPIVYLRDPEKAGLKIRAFLDRRSESPLNIMRAPIGQPAPAQSEKLKKGENLSLKM